MLQDGNKELPPERYDAKLFQQAYRAGLKAKELDKKKAKKDKTRKYLLYASILPLLLLTVFIVKPKPPERYISASYMDSQDAKIENPEIFNTSVKGISDINISAKSALVYRVDGNQVIFKKEENRKIYPASLTKLVTAMVMIDTYGLDYDLEVTKDLPKDLVWSIGLEKGDVINTSELLKLMLISSYNDAALVIANEYGYEQYIAKMNSKLTLLGCDQTNFINPTGLHDNDHYSTAKDLQKIVNVALKYPSILEVSDHLGSEVKWISEGNIKTEYIYTTNQLLGNNRNVKGLKTGYTEEAGQCLITIYEKDFEKYITILLGSEDRFGETQRILNNIY